MIIFCSETWSRRWCVLQRMLVQDQGQKGSSGESCRDPGSRSERRSTGRLFGRGNRHITWRVSAVGFGRPPKRARSLRRMTTTSRSLTYINHGCKTDQTYLVFHHRLSLHAPYFSPHFLSPPNLSPVSIVSCDVDTPIIVGGGHARHRDRVFTAGTGPATACRQ